MSAPPRFYYSLILMLDNKNNDFMKFETIWIHGTQNNNKGLLSYFNKSSTIHDRDEYAGSLHNTISISIMDWYRILWYDGLNFSSMKRMQFRILVIFLTFLLFLKVVCGSKKPHNLTPCWMLIVDKLLKWDD